MAARMIRAAATPSHVRLRIRFSDQCLEMHPSVHRVRMEVATWVHRGTPRDGKAPASRLEGEGRQRRRVIRMEGAYLLPRLFEGAGLLTGYCTLVKREASEWTDSGMEAAELDDSNVKRGEETLIRPGRALMPDERE